MLGIIGSVVGGLIGNSGAKKAAAAQERSAREQLDFSKEVYGDQVERFAPYAAGGGLANDAILSLLGLGDAPMIGANALRVETVPGAPSQVTRMFMDGERERSNTFTGPPGPNTYRVGDRTFSTMAEAQAYADANSTPGTQWGGFQADPGFRFRQEQGNEALRALNAARGGGLSGRTLQDAMEFNSGLASQEYGNFFNRLAGQQGIGLQAAGLTANAGGAAVQNVGNALANIGDARASGAIGGANAINQGIGNALGAWQYQQGLARPPSTSTSGSRPWWLGTG